MILATDRRNAAEYHARLTSLAVKRYRERLAEGVPHPAAYADALAYLRRKTGWGAPVACAALDGELAPGGATAGPAEPRIVPLT